MPSSAVSLATGVAFGSALTISGVAVPRIIIDQFRMFDYHMLLTFLTASACSAAVFAAARSSGSVSIPCKKNNSYGWFGSFDGNIIGGLLLGIGMTLSGACPGTVLVQAAAGVGRSQALLGSGLLAGIAFAKWKQRNQLMTMVGTGKHSIPEITGWSEVVITVSYEIVLLSTILAASVFAPRSRSLFQPIAGGILIGLTQVLSVIIARKPLGVSTAYEDIGQTFWAYVEGKPVPGTENITFVAGMLVGARLMMQIAPKTLEVFSPDLEISTPVSIIGGFTLIFGARLAGGCTSGHGISGMSSMGLSSFITVACMFAGGIGAAALIR